jgi:hypothetical protein
MSLTNLQHKEPKKPKPPKRREVGASAVGSAAAKRKPTWARNPTNPSKPSSAKRPASSMTLISNAGSTRRPAQRPRKQNLRRLHHQELAHHEQRVDLLLLVRPRCRECPRLHNALFRRLVFLLRLNPRAGREEVAWLHQL